MLQSDNFHAANQPGKCASAVASAPLPSTAYIGTMIRLLRVCHAGMAGAL
jgi:hypothetical protein